MSRNATAQIRTVAHTAFSAALFAAAGVIAATLAASPASAGSQLTRYWGGQLVEPQAVESIQIEAAAVRPQLAGSQLARYWSGELSDRKALRQNLALAESIAVHTGGGVETAAAAPRAVESGPHFWGDTRATR